MAGALDGYLTAEQWADISCGLVRDLEVHVLAANAGAALSGVAMPMEQPRPTFDPVEFGRDLKWGAGWAAWYAAAEELP